MRILLGTTEICRHLYDLTDAFRRLGHEADSVVVGPNPFNPDLRYDVLIQPPRLQQHLIDLQQNPIGTFLQMPEGLARLRALLTQYDVYIFQFAYSLLPGNQDYPILKHLGKQIIALFNGSDVRHWSAAEPVAAAYGYQIPEMCRDEPYSDLNARLNNLRMAERYADAIFSLPFQSELAVRPYHHFFIPVNPALYEHHIPARDVPLLVHAPSRRTFKGTDQFLAVLDRLRDEGVAFELKLLEGVPNDQVLQALTQADVVLDELHAPHYAMLALEGMATGCTVVAGCNRDYVPVQGDSPVVDVRPDTLYDRLKHLLTDKALRLDHARRGRPFVQAHHHHIQVAANLLAALNTPPASFDYYPSFFARTYHYPAETAVHPKIACLTAEVVQRYGLPDGVQVDDLIDRALIDAAALAPEKPVLPWRPAASYGVREQIWGYSPRATQDPEAPPIDPATEQRLSVIDLVHQALDALDEDDTATAVAILQQCIEAYQAAPDVFSHADVLGALGRLAVELKQPEAAHSMFTMALTVDPTRRDLRITLQALLHREAA